MRRGLRPVLWLTARHAIVPSPNLFEILKDNDSNHKEHKEHEAMLLSTILLVTFVTFVVHYYLMVSIPFMYWRSTGGTVTLPSAFWYSSSTGIKIRGLAITVLLSVWQYFTLPSASR